MVDGGGRVGGCGVVVWEMGGVRGVVKERQFTEYSATSAQLF